MTKNHARRKKAETKRQLKNHFRYLQQQAILKLERMINHGGIDDNHDFGQLDNSLLMRAVIQSVVLDNSCFFSAKENKKYAKNLHIIS